MKTIVELVDNVYMAATEVGMDVSPKDVGFIVSLFFEGLVGGEPANPALDEWLQKIADEAGSVRDE